MPTSQRATTIAVSRELAIPGVLELALPRFTDDRGTLVKTFQRSHFEQLGLPGEFTEQFHSRSAAGVVRGLHFQTPPSDLYKVVTCITGEAYDVVVDLREGSPAFGEHVVVGLNEPDAIAVAIPPGCAHGFLARADDTVLGYWTTCEHDPAHDAGIRWDSAGIDWPLEGEPVVSERDRALPGLAQFDSPFRFAASA